MSRRPSSTNKRASTKENQKTGGKASPPEEPDEATLQRQLSFIDASVAQIRDAITKEEPSWKFNSNFWYTILADEPSPSFRLLQNRTLQFWIGIYNKWLDLGKGDERPPFKLQLSELQELFPANMNFDHIIQLFDPAGAKAIRSQGPSAYKKIKVSIVELLTAGVMLSRLIPSKHKLRFLFGLVDWDDSRDLNEQEFVHFVKAFMRGIGAAFGLERAEVPSTEAIANIADRLYKRISFVSAQRLKDLSAQSDATRAALIKAIKARQAAMEGPGAESSTNITDRNMLRQPTNEKGRSVQVLRFEVLQDWAFRVHKDPLALPFALTIERFCGREDDGLHEQVVEWHLSHTEKVDLPKEAFSSEAANILRRWEVVMLRDIFNCCKNTGCFFLDFEEIQAEIKTTIPRHMWSNVSAAMARCRDFESRGKRIDLFTWFKSVSSSAQPCHLRMYDKWCRDFDERDAKKDEIAEAMQVRGQFDAQDFRPIIPLEELVYIHREFDLMDKSTDGLVSVWEIASHWNWSDAEVRETVMKYDLSENCLLDKDEFTRMMCPANYRLPEMAGPDREVFGIIVRGEEADRKREFKEAQDLFAKGDGIVVGRSKEEMPPSLYPEVEDQVWLQWNMSFDNIDEDGDNYVSLNDVVGSNTVTEKVARFVCSILKDPSTETLGFSRKSFLAALLEATRTRRVGFTLS
eukprot:TRINITY_DN5143_c0_g2_i1.p1 TRINITY_DN5143_c0_g2~~TRINITY_DN5143_c0_g2_i1.p1  ORF type:complete len:689 (-),score=112.81 TRINITY_DN5143_c0_g2_i1:399-2465(-)